MISKIQYISQGRTPEDHLINIQKYCSIGGDWVQLRLKNIGFNEYVQYAKEAKSICKKVGATIIINDNAEVAMVSGADGVHLGKNDMSPKEARSMLKTKIIGGTANTLDDCKRLSDAQVDYIGLGPFQYTTTKSNLSPVLGLDGYWRITRDLSDDSPPVCAIGGIEINNVSELIKMGVYGIAASTLLTKLNTKTELDHIKSLVNGNG